MTILKNVLIGFITFAIPVGIIFTGDIIFKRLMYKYLSVDKVNRIIDKLKSFATYLFCAVMAIAVFYIIGKTIIGISQLY